MFGLIMKAIISGMIIEAFGMLRRTAQAQTKEKNNICPICNLSRKELGKYQVDFNLHRQNDHNPWNFIWFNNYIANKKRTN